MHGFGYDAIHDEIVVNSAIAQGILTFRGGANGEEPPIRVIQGSLTQLQRPDQLEVDPVHNEIFVPQRGKVDRKSTRLNSSHQIISYAVFCLKKKKHKYTST